MLIYRLRQQIVVINNLYVNIIVTDLIDTLIVVQTVVLPYFLHRVRVIVSRQYLMLVIIGVVNGKPPAYDITFHHLCHCIRRNCPVKIVLQRGQDVQCVLAGIVH